MKVLSVQRYTLSAGYSEMRNKAIMAIPEHLCCAWETLVLSVASRVVMSLIVARPSMDGQAPNPPLS